MLLFVVVLVVWASCIICGAVKGARSLRRMQRGGSCKTNLAPGIKAANIAVHAVAKFMKCVSFIIVEYVCILK